MFANNHIVTDEYVSGIYFGDRIVYLNDKNGLMIFYKKENNTYNIVKNLIEFDNNHIYNNSIYEIMNNYNPDNPPDIHMMNYNSENDLIAGILINKYIYLLVEILSYHLNLYEVKKNLNIYTLYNQIQDI